MLVIPVENKNLPTNDRRGEKSINLCYNFAIFLNIIKEMRMILPKKIKRLRTRCFLTQEDFARKLGVAFSTVNRWEQGKSKPNLAAMKNIKAFCEENDIPYADIEDAWLNYKVGGKNNG
ncbi:MULTISPECIES: helix-turn-helix domain-containing protein [Acidaminococcus]|uniref:helix-turn-helix domain-containing protein n=1 Tax=Acidaminococcus TaxID=904 RepID=UPI001A9E03AD|nr:MULTISPECIES: helix-turn-helix domain-containing protein [Acidaminococcus]